MGAPLEDVPTAWAAPPPPGGRDVPGAAAGSRDLAFRPVLDVTRGVAAGYAALPTAPTATGRQDATQVASARRAHDEQPAGTFLSVPVDAEAAIASPVRSELQRAESLEGIVVEVGGRRRLPDLRAVADEIRGSGGILALSGGDSGQPALAAIVNLRPSIITLGRDWIRNLENSTRKQMMVETVGRLASSHDAWILAEDVRSDAELRTLAELGVPLAVGPFIGAPGPGWSAVDVAAVNAVPAPSRPRGPLRDLLRPVLTVRSVGEAAALAANLQAGDHLVVVESDQRPRSLICLTAGHVEPHEIMSVNVATPLGDALRRAELRGESERWLPFAVTDDSGCFLGLVNVDPLRS
jgi:EAL domain-containing protein (putative c-di-GMP-specific phosphodiesterase class I)